MERAYAVLKNVFGYDSFREGQEGLIAALLSGRDSLAIMPTGAGKSLCFQIPALLLPGITLVISPLISLMKDQVAGLRQAGVAGAYINSSLTPAQTRLALSRAEQGQYKIIYVAPERLETQEFLAFAQAAQLSMVTVDEAHCVSQWGNDFRPSYRHIATFLGKLAQRPCVSAFTATATPLVARDIEKLIGLRDPLRVKTGFDRPNLYFEVRKPKDKMAELLGILARRRDTSGIIYCSTRKKVEEVCDRLQAEGYSALRYHAGLSEEERRENQESFQYDRCLIMVATNAFGMGIDKSNVSFVIHFNMPRNVEAYYQEAGRAGRDGSPADCILLYSGQDVITGRWMINHSDNNPELSLGEQQEIKGIELDKLKEMAFYCNTQGCLRGFIRRYFGEKTWENCGACSSCLKVGKAGQEEAREAPGDAGSQDAGRSDRTRKPRQPRKPRRDRPEAAPGQREPGAGLRMVGSGDWPAREGQSSQTASRKNSPRSGGEKREEQSPADDRALYERLKALRLALAREAQVPAYVVFSDATLREMAAQRPRNGAELLRVSGVGQVKLERYGAAFLECIGNRGDTEQARAWTEERENVAGIEVIKRKPRKPPF